MIALVDCNSFFCSVEKVFHPGLKGKPVCVLSNNDGCIIALTPEAKALGLVRGEPIFKKRDVIEHNKIALFSTNMYLYAAMSKRVVSTLRSAVHRVESYSIDECFCYLDEYEKLYNIEEYMRNVAEQVKLYTDIPVSVGIAPSKTLAKLGSIFAKKHKGYRSVCVIDTEEKRRKALQYSKLSDIWGIGRQTLYKLNYLGIHTPLEFADKTESWVKRNLNLPGVQTWQELNGISCIDTSEAAQRKSICTSRSFGEMVTDLNSLSASVANFAASCANKLRAQHSVAGSVTVFVLSNRFRKDLPQYRNGQTAMLPMSTCDTIEITKAALSVLKDIYREGVTYKKAGVILGNITSASAIQQNLFDDIKNRPQRFKLMKNIDDINHKFGIKKIHLAVEEGNKQSWRSKSEHRSGNYLSDINEILTINI